MKTHLRNFTVFILFGVMIVFSFWTIAASGLSINREVVSFGSRSFAPYTFIGEKDLPGGFMADILDSAVSHSTTDLRMVLGDWTSLKKDNQAGEFDILLGLSFARASSQILGYNQLLVNTSKSDFSIDRFLSRYSRTTSGKDLKRLWFFIPVVDVDFTFFGRKTNIEDPSLNEILDKNVVVRRDSEGHFYLRDRGLDSRVSLSDSEAEALYMIRSGEADYVLMSDHQGRYLVDKLNLVDIVPLTDELFSSNQGLIVTGGNISLTRDMIQGMEIIREEGLYKQLYQKWFSRYSNGRIDPSLIGKILLGIFVLITVFVLWLISVRRQVSRIVREREKIMDFTRDGIVAVDGEGKISLLNRTAIELAGLEGNEKGLDVDNCIPELGLTDVLKTGEAVNDYEHNVNGRVLVTNKAPVKVRGEITGAIATFRDTTEIRAMSQEITGVKMDAESLRI